MVHHNTTIVKFNYTGNDYDSLHELRPPIKSSDGSAGDEARGTKDAAAASVLGALAQDRLSTASTSLAHGPAYTRAGRPLRRAFERQQGDSRRVMPLRCCPRRRTERCCAWFYLDETLVHSTALQRRVRTCRCSPSRGDRRGSDRSAFDVNVIRRPGLDKPAVNPAEVVCFSWPPTANAVIDRSTRRSDQAQALPRALRRPGGRVRQGSLESWARPQVHDHHR